MLSNAIKKQIKKLHQKKYRYEHREFLIEGIKGVEEALKDAEVLVVIIEGSRRDEPAFQSIIELAGQRDVAVEFCGRKDVAEIKTTDTFPGVQAVVEMSEIELEDVLDGSPVIILEQVKDPGNLGTIIRTADWFGIKNVILTEKSVDPYNDKTVRSTMGSLFRMNIINKEKDDKLLRQLKEKKYNLYALDMGGKSIYEGKVNEPAAYVFGSESQGLSDGMKNAADEVLSIPGKGTAESLNLGVSAAIVMAHISQ
jgi:RNA methyltransferase, TrmH family